MFQVLTLKDTEEETQDDRQGKMLLHTEYSLLSLLHNQDGVIHHHGFFKVNCLAKCNYFPVLINYCHDITISTRVCHLMKKPSPFSVLLLLSVSTFSSLHLVCLPSGWYLHIALVLYSALLFFMFTKEFFCYPYVTCGYMLHRPYPPEFYHKNSIW